MYKKKQILKDNLLNDTYCRINCSSISGVGVFAIYSCRKST